MSTQANDSQLRPSATPWGHRPHLDGLRAIAVYLVVAFHSRLVVFEGGFIGVDLFFTLSGYLVTMVLLTDIHQNDRVRLVRFYSRRARRLLPAASVAIVGTSLAALLVLSSVDRSRLVDDATASSLWYTNWHFIGEASDYFDVDGGESPFLHFWSLAIEEQFYLAFPLVVMLVWRTTRRLSTVMWMTGTLFLISALLQWRTAVTDPNTAYLATHTRVYQVLAGALLAMTFWRWNARTTSARSSVDRAARPLAVVLIALLVVAGSSALNPTTSQRGFLAAVLSVLVIGTLEIAQGGSARRLLALQPIRFLGQISYGTYLWHWPVLVLSTTILEFTPTAAFILATTVGTGLAALSADLLERPIRLSRLLDSRPKEVLAAGLALAVIAGAAVAPSLLRSNSQPGIRAAQSHAVPDESSDTREPVPDFDWRSIQQANPEVPACVAPDASDCFVTHGDGATTLLVGDSHARMLIPAFEEIARSTDGSLAVSFAPSCPWQLSLIAGSTDDRFSDNCRETRRRTYDGMIDSVDADLVVVVGFPRSTSLGNGSRVEIEEWSDLPLAERVELVTRASADAIIGAGVPLLMIQPVPILAADQLSCLSAARFVDECVMLSLDEGVEETVMKSLAASSSRIATLDLDMAICPRLPTCDAIVGDQVVRRDAHHLTQTFAETLSDQIVEALMAFD